MRDVIEEELDAAQKTNAATARAANNAAAATAAQLAKLNEHQMSSAASGGSNVERKVDALTNLVEQNSEKLDSVRNAVD